MTNRFYDRPVLARRLSERLDLVPDTRTLTRCRLHLAPRFLCHPTNPCHHLARFTLGALGHEQLSHVPVAPIDSTSVPAIVRRAASSSGGTIFTGG